MVEAWLSSPNLPYPQSVQKLTLSSPCVWVQRLSRLPCGKHGVAHYRGVGMPGCTVIRVPECWPILPCRLLFWCRMGNSDKFSSGSSSHGRACSIADVFKIVVSRAQLLLPSRVWLYLRNSGSGWNIFQYVSCAHSPKVDIQTLLVLVVVSFGLFVYPESYTPVPVPQTTAQQGVVRSRPCHVSRRCNEKRALCCVRWTLCFHVSQLHRL